MLLGFADRGSLPAELAALLGRPMAQVEVHRFPDGESRVHLPTGLPPEIILCRSLDNPNDKLIELLLAARCARNLGARRLTLVAPYLCYMRQDTAFAPGEAVSQRIIGDFLAGLFDALVTVDPHLHRTHSLEEAVPVAAASAVTAAGAMGEFLAASNSDALLLGPDRESEQWVAEVAARARLDYAVADKQRSGDYDVVIALPDARFAARQVVLVDDVASTGRTLAEAARVVRGAGAERVDALITHGLFTGDALAEMRDAGIGSVWTSNSIAHASNAFSVAPAIAEAVAAMR